MPYQNIVDADLEYALRMISTGSTVEQAAQMCGIPLATLQAHVRQSSSAPASTAKAFATTADTTDSASRPRAAPSKSGVDSRPRSKDTGFTAREDADTAASNVAALVPSTTVYGRTAKGVLAFTAQAKRFAATLKQVFFAVDDKATVGQMLATLQMNPAYIHRALRALESDGYIKVSHHAAEGNAAQAADDNDLDFSTPEALAKAESLTTPAAPTSLRDTNAGTGNRTEKPQAAPAPKLTGRAPKAAAAAPRIASPAANDAAPPLLRPGNKDPGAQSSPPAPEPVRANAERSKAPVQKETSLKAELSALEAAQANVEAYRIARDEAMQLLEEAVKALRDMKSSAAEEQRQRTHGDAESLKQRNALQARLEEAEAELVQAKSAALQAQLEISKERRAREDAEAEADAERRARSVDAHALEDARQQAQDAETARRASAIRLEELQAALKAVERESVQLGKRLEEMQHEIAAERRARDEAQLALDTERHAHGGTSKALSELKEAIAAERLQHEEHARALAQAQALRNALDLELAAAKTERERAIEAAYRHAERHAEIEVELETQRRALEEAEERARAAQQGREEAAQALLEVRKAVGRWGND